MAFRISKRLPLPSGVVTFDSPADMQAWGARLAGRLRARDAIALVGELGSGKTTLAQSIAKARGYRRRATSPTFALANEYETPKGPIYHLDLYRLSQRELASFPLEEYLEQGLCLIEWAEKVRERWPKGVIEIHLAIRGPRTREVKLRKI
jgi:tRNA threonylcarbamoyladenosine biosynthesis protein TsaE